MPNIQSATDKCQYVSDNCNDVPESLNLFVIKYCYMENSILFATFLIFIIIVSFYLLGNIADTYLTPVLTKISETLNLSETIAGVTLLAFANGAPDIIASITAAGAGSDSGEEADPTGMYIGAGALFGAFTFGGTVVLGYCVSKSKTDVTVRVLLIFRCLLESG